MSMFKSTPGVETTDKVERTFRLEGIADVNSSMTFKSLSEA